MFDKLIRELKKMERMSVSIPIETDSEGYYDKECPSDNCMKDGLEKLKEQGIETIED